MGTYQIGGSIQQSARYIGQFVAADDTVQYYYVVVAYDQYSQPLSAGGFCTAMGPITLDGDHAINVQWSPILGAWFYNVYKSSAGSPPASDGSAPTFWCASGSETGVLDVGYPCTTRNSFLNPGGSPIFLLQQPPAPVPPTDPCVGTPGVMVPCPEVNPLNIPVPNLKVEEIDYGLL